MKIWTADRDGFAFTTPEGPVIVRRGQVIVVAVLDERDGAHLLTDICRREQALVPNLGTEKPGMGTLK